MAANNNAHVFSHDDNNIIVSKSQQQSTLCDVNSPAVDKFMVLHTVYVPLDTL